MKTTDRKIVDCGLSHAVNVYMHSYKHSLRVTIQQLSWSNARPQNKYNFNFTVLGVKTKIIFIRSNLINTVVCKFRLRVDSHTRVLEYHSGKIFFNFVTYQYHTRIIGTFTMLKWQNILFDIGALLPLLNDLLRIK